MPNYPLNPGDSHKFHDTEGGSDLVVANKSDATGQYTISNDDGPATQHSVASGHHATYEVAYHQTATVTNTGTVQLIAEFPEQGRA
ncbi:MAG TPA: hypothetical protein VGG48_07995 [Rhizomicrobium sp.]